MNNQANETEKQIVEATDKLVLDHLENLKAENEPMSAAMLNAITRRYGTIAPVVTPGSTRDQIIENMAEAGMKFPGSTDMPDVDLEHDDAATA